MFKTADLSLRMRYMDTMNKEMVNTMEILSTDTEETENPASKHVRFIAIELQFQIATKSSAFLVC